MKEHDMEGKEERRRESCWGSRVEKKRGVGLREYQCLHSEDSLHSPHPVGPRRVLSIHILVAVSPFGDLSVRERVTSFSLSFLSFFFFLVGSNRIAISLCSHWCFSACMGSTVSRTTRCQSDYTVISLLIIPSLSLLVHWRQGLHKGGVTSVCLYTVYRLSLTFK